MNSNNNTIDKSTLRKTFFRSIPMEHSWNYERMMNLGYCFAMIPALKKIYGGNKDELSKSLTRHLEFYNTTPYVVTLPLCISIAMEENRAKDIDKFDTESINMVKTALMGPIAGIGDSFYWGTLRVLATGIGTSLATQGNILGPILFLLIFNIPNFGIRYWLTFFGYRLGTSVLQKIESSGIMEKITYAASVIGLSVAGAMTAEMVNVNIGGRIGKGDDATTFQDILNGIIPGLLPLGLTFLVIYLLKKKMKPLPLLIIMMFVCIVLAYFKILVLPK